MGELEDRLNGILSNPKEMEKLIAMAKTLSGSLGGAQQSESGDNTDTSPSGGAPPIDGLDPKLMGLFARLAGEYNRGDDKTALISAIKPYLREERRDAVERAAKLAKLARLAKLALGDLGGGGWDV